MGDREEEEKWLNLWEQSISLLSADGPGYQPGTGGEELTTASADGGRRRVHRDLNEERRRADALIEACPVL
ncbi:MAG TPA: hypothetical protein EYP85_09925, partial [Armatimonadetes bacterium]|nr:hypothetical protein [Armatimonadota bacterium]